MPHIRPDLIILDLHFKNGFDGTSFLQCYQAKIKSLGYKPPVIVLSGLDNHETVDYVMTLGANGYVSKPFEPQMLMTMIYDYLGESPSRSYDQIQMGLSLS